MTNKQTEVDMEYTPIPERLLSQSALLSLEERIIQMEADVMQMQIEISYLQDKVDKHTNILNYLQNKVRSIATKLPIIVRQLGLEEQ